MPPDGAAASLRLSDKNRIIAASHSVITLFFTNEEAAFARKRLFHILTTRTAHPSAHLLTDAARTLPDISLSTSRRAAACVG